MEPEHTGAIVISLTQPVPDMAVRMSGRLVGDDLAVPCHVGSAEGLIDDLWLDELADGLAAQAWMEMDVSACLPVGLIEALRHEVGILHKTDAMNRAGVGRGGDLVKDRSIRRDKIAWLEGFSAPQAELYQFFDRVREGLNRRLFLGLKRYEAHYATYQPGDFYTRHLDSFRGRASRVVSLVLYLNEDWGLEDGGELRVFSPADTSATVGVVKPQGGRAVVFLSEEVPHEVLPARRTRYSIACWFRQDEVPLPL